MPIPSQNLGGFRGKTRDLGQGNHNGNWGVRKKPPQRELGRFVSSRPWGRSYLAAAAGAALAVSFSLIRADLPLRSRK